MICPNPTDHTGCLAEGSSKKTQGIINRGLLVVIVFLLPVSQSHGTGYATPVIHKVTDESIHQREVETRWGEQRERIHTKPMSRER